MIIPAMVTLHIVSAALYAAETGASAPPASAPIYSSGVKSGTLEFAAITEASGLAASRKNPGCCGSTTIPATPPASSH